MSAVWAWLGNNQGQVGAVLSALTLGVWVLYLQLLLNSYRHQRRPKILINMGAGHTIDAKCVVANMSAEPIYIEAVVLSLALRERQVVCTLSNLNAPSTPEVDPRSQWFQGTLDSGELLDLGSYGDLIERTGVRPTDAASMLTVTVVATYTAEDGLVAAERAFDLTRESGNCLLHPRSLVARQIRSRRARRALEHLIFGDRDTGPVRRRRLAETG